MHPILSFFSRPVISACWLAAGFWPTVQAAVPQVKLDLVCDGQLDSPVAMVHAGDGSGRMFIAEQRGKIRIFKDGMLLPGHFLNLGTKVIPERANYDERGLLGLAFHPGYANVGSPGYRRFYVFYIAPSPNAPGVTTAPVDSRTVISEFRVSPTDPNVADPASERVLLSFDKPQFNHAGGGLDFGPDGLLYFTVGDGGSSNDNNFGHTGGASPRLTSAKGNAQDLTKIFGKMHRIDPLGTNAPGGQYGIPPTNPFAASPNGERREIYAYGLRNCWRFSFDKRPGGTGRLIAADVGQNAVEEIDLITLGGNYGWRNREGSFVPAFSIDAPVMAGPAIDPIGQYAHPGVTIGSPALPQLGLSVTGGYIYRGSAIPALVGKYVFGDWSQNPIVNPSPAIPVAKGVMLALEETIPGTWALSQMDVLGGNPLTRYIQGFGEDESGELYVLTKRTQAVTAVDATTGLPTGAILKVVPVPATTALTLTAAKDNTIFQEAELSNGAGDWIFAGATDPSKNNAALRRALVSWNLATVPAGATIATASVTMKMDRTISPAYDFSLHKLLANWGEGTSNAAVQEGDGAVATATDVTWNKPFFGQVAAWITPGGDFSPARSATTSVNTETSVSGGIYTWAAPGLAADVNAWLANSATNFGWMLKGDVESVVKAGTTGAAGQMTITVVDTDGLVSGMVVEGTGIGVGAKIAPGGINTGTFVVTLTVANTTAVSGSAFFGAPSAKRFASRTATLAASRPKLTLNYIPAPAAPSHRRAWELTGYLPGQFMDDAYDTDGDGIIDGLEYAWGYSPRTAQSLGSGFTVNATALSGTGPVVLTFRRDPLATDITYRAQVTSDLTTWTTLTTSAAGAAPTGSGFVSEVVADAPFRTVSVRDVVPAGSRRLYRLQVTRP
jgi:glucose/arabinose dehydrogenase